MEGNIEKGPRESQTPPHLTIIGDCENPILELYCCLSRCYAVALTGVADPEQGLQIEVSRLTFTPAIIWCLGMVVAHGLCVSAGESSQRGPKL